MAILNWNVTPYVHDPGRSLSEFASGRRSVTTPLRILATGLAECVGGEVSCSILPLAVSLSTSKTNGRLMLLLFSDAEAPTGEAYVGDQIFLFRQIINKTSAGNTDMDSA